MAPLLLIVISIAGLIFGEDVGARRSPRGLRGLMGEAPAQAIDAALASMSKPTNGFTSAALSGVVLLIGATSVFGELQDALDRIWRAPERDRTGGLWRLVRSRFVVVRHGARNRLPADGVARRQRGDFCAWQMVERCVRQLGKRCCSS
jgi:membrane protein